MFLISGLGENNIVESVALCSLNAAILIKRQAVQQFLLSAKSFDNSKKTPVKG